MLDYVIEMYLKMMETLYEQWICLDCKSSAAVNDIISNAYCAAYIQ
jgi:hypothetical protein